MVPFSVTLTDT